MEDITHNLGSTALGWHFHKDELHTKGCLGDEDHRMASRGRGKKNVERSLMEERNSISDDKDSGVHCHEATVHTSPTWMTNFRAPLGPDSQDTLLLEAPWHAEAMASGTLKVFPKWRMVSGETLTILD